MTLVNVAYIPNFTTNLVSQSKLRAKGLYFDDWKMHLHQEGKTIGLVELFHGHYLLENNSAKPQDHSSAAVSTITKSASMQD